MRPARGWRACFRNGIEGTTRHEAGFGNGSPPLACRCRHVLRPLYRRYGSLLHCRGSFRRLDRAELNGRRRHKPERRHRCRPNRRYSGGRVACRGLRAVAVGPRRRRHPKQPRRSRQFARRGRHCRWRRQCAGRRRTRRRHGWPVRRGGNPGDARHRCRYSLIRPSSLGGDRPHGPRGSGHIGNGRVGPGVQHQIARQG